MLMDSHMCEKIHHLIKEKTNKVDGEVNKCPVAGVNEIRELLCIAGHLTGACVHGRCVFGTLSDIVECLLSTFINQEVILSAKEHASLNFSGRYGSLAPN